MSQKGQSSKELESGAERFLRWLGPLRPSVKALKRLSLVFPILHALVCTWFIIVSLTDQHNWPVGIAPILAVNGISGLITALPPSFRSFRPLVKICAALAFVATFTSLKLLLELTNLSTPETILWVTGGLFILSYQFFHHARLENLALESRSSPSAEIKEP